LFAIDCALRCHNPKLALAADAFLRADQEPKL